MASIDPRIRSVRSSAWALTSSFQKSRGSRRTRRRDAPSRARKKTLFTARLPDLEPTPGAGRSSLISPRLGKRLIVATSADDVEMNALLERAGVADLIHHRASKDDAARSKPDPDIVAAALGKAETPAGRVVMIGDTPYDIDAARGVGVATIALRCGGYWEDDDLASAAAVLDHPEALFRAWEHRA